MSTKKDTIMEAYKKGLYDRDYKFRDDLNEVWCKVSGDPVQETIKFKRTCLYKALGRYVYYLEPFEVSVAYYIWRHGRPLDSYKKSAIKREKDFYAKQRKSDMNKRFSYLF